jgi:transcriptional regulator with XRE-family HTH domain
MLVNMRKNISGPRIRQARLLSRPHLTQRQLANRVTSLGTQISRGSIAKIEIGIRYVYDFEILILAKALNVPVSRLLPWRRGVPR